MIKLLNIVVLCAMCSCVLSEDDNILEEMTSAFKKMDTNNDGKVTIEEVAALLEKMKPDEGANVMEMAEPVFEYYDKDKDGIIVLSELLPRDEL